MGVCQGDQTRCRSKRTPEPHYTQERILNGRNKKPSPPPGWATIRLGHTRQTITNNNNGKIKYIIINYKSEEEERMIPNNSPPEIWGRSHTTRENNCQASC